MKMGLSKDGQGPSVSSIATGDSTTPPRKGSSVIERPSVIDRAKAKAQAEAGSPDHEKPKEEVLPSFGETPSEEERKSLTETKPDDIEEFIEEDGIALNFIK